MALNELVGKSGYQTIRRSGGIFFYTTSLNLAQIQMPQKLELPPVIGPDKKMSLLNHLNPDLVPEARPGSFQGVDITITLLPASRRSPYSCM